jgi:hypothetical protein
LFNNRWVTYDRGIAYTLQLSSGSAANGRNVYYLTANGVIPPIELDGATHNEIEVFDALQRGANENLNSPMALAHEKIWTMARANDVAGVRDAAQQLSGSFYVDLLTLSADNSNSDILQSINRDTDKWATVSYGAASYDPNENASSNLNVKTLKVQGVKNISREENKVEGLYASLASKAIDQSRDRASVVDIEVGTYKGWFFGDNTAIKANAGLALGVFDVERGINVIDTQNRHSSFEVYTGKLGIEVWQTIWKTVDAMTEMNNFSANNVPAKNEIAVKVFGGVDAGLSLNNDITETGDLALVVNSNYYAKVSAKLGFRVDGTRGLFEWYGKTYLGGLGFASKAAYDMSLDGFDMDKIEGSKQDSIYTGFGTGVDYKIGPASTIGANLLVNAGSTLVDYYGGASFNVKFK